jgi:SAM-dependent methyltransferase
LLYVIIYQRALVHCTDSSDAAVAAVQTVASSSGTTSSSSFNHRLPPPPNLVKSVADLCDLSQFASNSMHAITCCYGYNLVDETDLEKALTQAYRVLTPGGILIVVNWESSALRFIGRDVLTGVKRGGGNFWEEDNNDDLFLPPLSALDPIALSGTTDGALLFSTGLEQAGFMRNHVPIVSVGSYPFNLGRSPDIQFFMGTFTVREELLQMGALSGDDDDDSVMMAGGWSCLAEESFWTNIRKYTGTAQPLADDDDDDDDDDGTMWLHGNQYKMSIMKK